MKAIFQLSVLIIMMATPALLSARAAAGDTCHAAFEVVLDSTSQAPYSYHFKDVSTGPVGSWVWDFGDGKFSTDRNPAHAFEDPGTYRICLTVAGSNGCSDQHCIDITTYSYFSLGGLVYAGELPLNNPVHQGDTGIASLYRYGNQQFIYVEDLYFHEFGYYWFGFLFPGEYMLRISLTRGSAHYRDFFPTYFSDKLTWTQAGMIKVENESNYEAGLSLQPVAAMLPGPGVIKGTVNFEQPNDIGLPPITQTTVILYNNDQTALTFTQPDESGFFEIGDLPYGTYVLKADATGKPSTAVTVTISGNTPVVEGINLTVFGSNISGLPETTGDLPVISALFPVPAGDRLTVKLYSPRSSSASVRVFDALGQECLTAYERLEPGVNSIKLNTSTLPGGVYLIRVEHQLSSIPAVAKFIK
jgi:PKD repeat protein